MCITIQFYIHTTRIYTMAIDLLNDKQIKALKPQAKTITYADGGGLHLEVTKDGSKRWRFRYRFDGKPVLKSLGIFPHVTLSQARTNRNKAKADIANGINPFPKKVKAESIKVEKTFKQWSEYYMTKVAGDVTETHLATSLKRWKKDVYKPIGDKPINSIKPKDIIAILNTMNDRGAKTSAKKVFSSISRVYDVCIANYPDDVEMNPCKSVSVKDVIGKTVAVHYPIMTDPTELGSLLNSIDDYKGHTSTKLALKMIANVFVRPANIRHAEWSEIDIDKNQWVIPASKMKTKNELIVPLSKQVRQILIEAYKDKYDTDTVSKTQLATASGLIFPSPKSKTQPLSDMALVGALRRLGYGRDEIVAHSFRGIFSTIAHEGSKYSHDVIETQLAHSVGSSVSQAYNRAVYLPERTEMMQWYSDLIGSYQAKATK